MHLICIMKIKLTILVILMFKKIKSEKIQGFSQLQTQQSTKPTLRLNSEVFFCKPALCDAKSYLHSNTEWTWKSIFENQSPLWYPLLR